MVEAIRYDEPQRQLQYHTGTASTGGKRQAMYHGQGVGIDEERENIKRFFQQLEKRLSPIFFEQKIPVVLAGVESLPPMYREQDSSGMLLRQILAGNPESMSPEDLHQKAWQLVVPVFAEEEKKAREKFQQLRGTDRVVTDIADIVKAAKAGRIETLFMVENIEKWGIFDARKYEATLTAADLPGAVDLSDLAVAWTLQGNGAVYIKKQDEMPVAEPTAAILRY
jgi:hypothetical protein